jgi:hypothetical protein
LGLTPIMIPTKSQISPQNYPIHRISSSSLTHHNPEEHIILACLIFSELFHLTSYAMTDSGATQLFIDIDFAKSNNIPLVLKAIPFTLEVVDGRPISSGDVIFETMPIQLQIGQHTESIVLNATRLGHYPIILGIPWLKLHDPLIVWSKHQLSFVSEYCAQNCLKNSVMVTALAEYPESLMKMSKNRDSNSFSKGIPSSTLPAVSIVSAVTFGKSSHQRQIYLMKLSEVLDHASSPQMMSTLPVEFQEFQDVFKKENADKLPEHRSYDHTIPLESDKSPPFGPIYSLSEVELKALREYIEENLSKGFITASSSPASAPILFDKKKDGSLRLCVDYRGLNKITIKNRYPLPLISEMLDRLSKAKYFSKIDLRGAYNLIRIKSGEEWKTAFRCRYGHFEYRVMPFGLTNAPASFQHFMNDTFRDYLDKFCLVYIDDILIYSETLEDNIQHVRLVLTRLRSASLYAKLEKCKFQVTEIEFLGYIISSKGISMDPSKVSAITSWPAPQSVHDIQVFIGFANFYRRFIENYSKIILPLTSLLKKNVDFSWTNLSQKAFEYLKLRFTTFPILRHFDPHRPSIIETDASDFAIACIISQRDDKGVLHPIAFYSRKLSSAEINYEIYDKEMLAIVTAFKEWRSYLEGAQHQTTVLTDHRNLEWFKETKKYTRRQARWAELLAGYDFIIVYRPGSKGGKPDALSRRSDYRLPEGEGEQSNETHQFLKPHQFVFSTSTVSSIGYNSNLANRIRNAIPEDAFLQPLLPYLENPALERSAEVAKKLHNYKLVDGLVLFRELIYVPDDASIHLTILKAHHDSPTSGHFGQAKTLEIVSREFYWPRIRSFVNNYIKSCDKCNRNKTPRHKPYGPLQPLPIPKGPWLSVSMDFIVELPQSSGYNAIYVVVDRFTKMAHFMATTTKTNAKDTADLYFREVFKLHGLPDDIVSDRGTQFTSKFWSRLLESVTLPRTCPHPTIPNPMDKPKE